MFYLDSEHLAYWLCVIPFTIIIQGDQIVQIFMALYLQSSLFSIAPDKITVLNIYWIWFERATGILRFSCFGAHNRIISFTCFFECLANFVVLYRTTCKMSGKRLWSCFTIFIHSITKEDGLKITWCVQYLPILSGDDPMLRHWSQNFYQQVQMTEDKSDYLF